MPAERDHLLSIVVPVYNVEQYLEPCLQSLLWCIEGSVEVLLINDGSTDQSPKIIDSYVSSYPDVFQRVDQENGGLSAARNTGLQLSKGDYIFFLDSDDLVDPAELKKLLYAAHSNDLEIAVGQFYTFWGGDDGDRENIDVPSDLLDGVTTVGLGLLERCFKSGFRRVNVWNKIYKRSFLQDNHLEFKKGLLYEDVPFTFQAMFQAARVQVFPFRVYGYRQRPGSIMTTPPKDAHLSRIWIVDYLVTLFDSENYTGKVFDDYMAYQLWECLRTSGVRPYPLSLRVLGRAKVSYRGFARLLAVFFLPAGVAKNLN